MKTVISTTNVSSNKKVGPLPTTASTADTCPDNCGLKYPLPGKKAPPCYFFSGYYTRMQAKRMVEHPEKYLEPADFPKWIRSLPTGQAWRDRVGGDQLPSADNKEQLDSRQLKAVVRANKAIKGRGWTYTHYDANDKHNADLLRFANLNGFTINASTDTLTDACNLMGQGFPVVTVLPIGSPKVTITEGGTKVVRCPAEYQDKLTCAKCLLCQDADRAYAIGFTAHGTGKNSADIIARAA